MFLWQIEELALVPMLTARARAANRAAPAGEQPARLAYGDDPRQHLLLFAPPAGAPARRSAVFFVHGGGWYTGSPDEFAFVGRFLARNGYPTAMPAYRLAPTHTYPVQNEDVLAAYVRFQCVAGELGCPADRIVVGGQSAGAQLGAFLAGEREALAGRGLDPAAVRGAFFVSGPLDFLVPGYGRWGRRLLRWYIGEGGEWQKADPGRLADDWRLPLFLVHGDRDPLVNLGSSLSFARRVHRRAPGLVETVVAPGRHHSDLTYMFLEQTPEGDRLLHWLERLDRDEAAGLAA